MAQGLTPWGDGPFRARSGPVTTPLLTGMVLGTSTEGPGWTAARISCAGDELALTVILPDTDLPAAFGHLTPLPCC